MVFGTNPDPELSNKPIVRDAFPLRPSESSACLLPPNAALYHRHGLAQADRTACLLTGQCPLPPHPPAAAGAAAPRSHPPGEYPPPDIITIEHNYCNRRAAKRAGGGGGGGARRVLTAHRWSCGAAALRTTRQRSRARSQARIEVDEAVDLVVGIQQPGSPSPGRRDLGLLEPGDPTRHRKEKEGLVWSGLGPSDEPGESLRPTENRSDGKAEEQPLKIHRLTPEEYKRVFSAVVGKALTNTASRPTRKCSLELARKIKEQLYNAVNRPTFKEIVHADGRVEFVERYNTLSRKKVPPHFELDTTGEPDCEEKGVEPWSEFAGKSM